MQDTTDVIVHIRDHTIHCLIPLLPFYLLCFCNVPSSPTSWFPPAHKYFVILPIWKQAFFWSIVNCSYHSTSSTSLQLFPISPHSYSQGLSIGSPYFQSSHSPLNWLQSSFQLYHFTETPFIKVINDVHTCKSNGIQSVFI